MEKQMKLVRDFIPQIIEESGRTCEWRKVKDRTEHIERLKEKIIEETDEFIENSCVEEAADMLEVLFAFTFLHDIDFEEVLDAAREKSEKRGGFMEGIILESATPRQKTMHPGMEWEPAVVSNDPTDW